MTQPVVIDTDPGIDDALALLLAFRTPGWEVAAVSTVAGNVPVYVATHNLARVIGVARPATAPVVAVGASSPRARALVTATHVHGGDGLGGVGALVERDGHPRFPEAPLQRHPGDAADLLIACARRWPGELLIVALGPLTNLALAVERDPAALRSVRRVVVMGGAVSVGGNVTAAAEFNMFVDPESAALVLGAGLPVTLVPLDATAGVRWPEDAVERLREAADPVASFAGELGRAGLRLAASAGEGGLTLHDPLAVGIALDPTLASLADLPLAVETRGEHTRGATVADRRPAGARRPAWPSARVALGADGARFLRLFEERLWRRSA